MSKEVTARSAMKLALEALNAATRYGAGGFEDAKDALRAALAKPDFWEGYVPEPMKPAQQGPVFSYTPDMDAVRRDEKEKADKFLAQLAQQALDKKAENARELGLDYEPAQQEPVAWMYPDDYERMSTSETFCTVYSVEVGSATRGESTVALYTSPTAQRTWVNATTWRGLTDEERVDLWKATETDNRMVLIDAIEAKLKEKNT